MYRLIATLSIAAAIGTQPTSTVSNSKPHTACELFSASEVAAFLKAPAAHVDSINSTLIAMAKAILPRL